MSENDLNQRVNLLASSLILADASQPDSLLELAHQLADVVSVLPDKDPRRDEAIACMERLNKAAAGGAEDDILQRLESLVDALQGKDRNDAADELDDGETFVLPEEVDDPLFREFLADQALSLEEFEREILGLEESVQLLPELRRRIHTLKGEAGLLGMQDLSELCHVIEDYLDVPPPSGGRTDHLLQCKDWIENSLETYSEMKVPPSGATELIGTLREVIAAASEAPPSPAPSDSRDAPADGEDASAAEQDEKNASAAQPEAAQPQATQAANSEPGARVERDEEDVALIAEFLQESEEGLVSVDQILLDGEQDGIDSDKVNSIFRVFHTIKGVSSFLGMEHITTLAHKTETMLDKVRSGHLQLSGTVLDLVFDATASMRELLAEIDSAVKEERDFAEAPGLEDLIENLIAATQGTLKVAKEVEVDVEEEVAPPPPQLGTILVHQGTASAKDVSAALVAQKESGRKLGEELIAQSKVAPKQVAKALRAQKQTTHGTPRMRETVKVDLDRVDALVENIGELVIVESMVAHAPEIAGLSSQKVRNYLGQLAKITRELQEIGIRMRMVPLRGVFQKMSRMVRDLGRKSNKQVRVEVFGNHTEMDRNMVEQVADPLVHLIRNAVDHGIETPEKRAADGKPAVGLIKLSAYHEGGSVVIEIADDGNGLNRDAILEKARKQKLLRDGESLSDQQVHELIFAPGFSTAKQVTEISGRGVGMDVVRRNVEAMRGRVQVSSKPGRGTTLKMVLPLTLAIIDGMLVSCGSERYIIPTLSIIESIQPSEDMVSTLAGQSELISIRGEVYPLLRLSDLLDIPNAKTNPTDSLIVIVETQKRRVGLMVDEVVTQQQVVIKSLGAGLQTMESFAGAAILSDGRVGLILNIDELGELLERGLAKLRSKKAAETGAEADTLAPAAN
jgi:two-component system chemotaxis sensor kinase CheA